jgi:hypothetical protein
MVPQYDWGHSLRAVQSLRTRTILGFPERILFTAMPGA